MVDLPVTAKDLYTEIRKRLLSGVDPDTADLDARLILEQRGGLSYLDLLTDNNKQINQESLTLIQQDLDARLSGKPIAKIFGEKEFWGRSFKVSEKVLDPRPDTESIIEAVLTWYKAEMPNKPITIADIGTGSGCIAITLLAEIPNATALAVDYSWDALMIARKNAHIHGVEERIQFVQGDYVSALGNDSCDVIVTNPPYIPTADITNLSESVKDYDPILALDGGIDGLAPYKKIFISLKNNLRPNGRLFLECGYDQIEAINRIGINVGANLKRIIYDLGGHARGGEFSCGDK